MILQMRSKLMWSSQVENHPVRWVGHTPVKLTWLKSTIYWFSDAPLTFRRTVLFYLFGDKKVWLFFFVKNQLIWGVQVHSLQPYPLTIPNSKSSSKIFERTWAHMALPCSTCIFDGACSGAIPEWEQYSFYIFLLICTAHLPELVKWEIYRKPLW